MAGNYNFKNTKSDFKRWCREFPSIYASKTLDTGYYKARGESYYMEARLVEHWSPGHRPIVVAQFRRYDEDTKNFERIPEHEIAEIRELYFTLPLQWFRESHRRLLEGVN